MNYSNISASAIANDLLLSMKAIDKSISFVQRSARYSLGESDALKNLQADLETFYSKVKSHFIDNATAHREAFQMSFEFPSLFKRAARLELILTYLYMVVESIEKNRMYYLIPDPVHMEYRDKLIKAFRGKVGTYVK